MPGVNLNLVYPVLGEPIATALAKLITMFQAIQTDIQALITPAEFDWLSDFSAKGHSLTHLASVQLDNAVIGAQPAGTMAFDGADFYLLTSAGSVKVTNGTTLNFASTGGIVGDYSSVGATVYFDSGTGQYRFFTGTGAWADVVADNVWLEAITGGGSIKLTADDVIASPYTFTLKAPPGAGTSVLTIDSTGVLLQGAPVTNAQTFAAITATNGLTVSGNPSVLNTDVQIGVSADLKHAGQWELTVPPVPTQSAGYSSNPDYAQPDGGASRVHRQLIPGLRVGDVIQKATFRWFRSAGTHTFDLKKVVDGVETSLLAAAASVSGGATQTTTVTPVAAYTVVSNEQYILVWSPPTLASLDKLYSEAVFVTH